MRSQRANLRAQRAKIRPETAELRLVRSMLRRCTVSSHSLETVQRRPLEMAIVTRTLKLTLKNLSEEVKIETNKSSSIVRKPAQLVHFLDLMEN